MQAYLIVLPKQGNDLHGTLFNALRQVGIKDFLPENPDRKSIVFHANGKHIIARINGVLENSPIPMISETLNVNKGDRIRGVVTLSRDRKVLIAPKDRAALIEELGRLLKTNENHKCIRMTDDDLNEYIPYLFAKAGLVDVQFKPSESALNHHRLTKRNKSFKTVDINFEAKIADLGAFEQAWVKGIGQSKTYGFGMIRAVVI